jgi:hypothetical protein
MTAPEPSVQAGDVEALAAALGDIRIAQARQADWWTSDEDHALLAQVLRGECAAWAGPLLASDWFAGVLAAERAAGAAEIRERVEAVLREVERRYCRSMCGVDAHDDDGCVLMLVAPCDVRRALAGDR